MKRQAKKLLCFLLVSVMMAGFAYIAPQPEVSAESYYYEANSWYALDMYLKVAGTCTIKLTKDIKKVYEMYGEGHKTVSIYGNKTIDLNGYKIECDDRSNIQKTLGGSDITEASHSTLFNVCKNSTLTVNDSKGGGEILFKGKHIEESKNYFCYAKRDVFSVDGTLVINAGKITAGNREKEWINGGETIASVWSSLYQSYNGNAYQVIWGTAVNVNENGKLIFNGGELYGRGIHIYQNTETFDAVMGERDEVIKVENGAQVSVNGGKIIAENGANVFAGEGVKNGLQIRGGTISSKKSDTLRVIFDEELYVNYLEGWGLAELVSTATIGSFNIPRAAYETVIGNLIVKFDGKEYKNFSDISSLNFDKENHYETVNIEFVKNNNGTSNDGELKLVYGAKVYDNSQTQYSYYDKTVNDIKLYCEIENPYFIEHASNNVCIWEIWVDNNTGEADHKFFTEENYINPLIFSSMNLTGKTVFVRGTLMETGPNNMTFSHNTNTFKLSPTDTPLGYLEFTEQSPAMEVGKNTAYIDGGYTESYVGYNFNHKPLPQELIDAGYYVERVYSLMGYNSTEIPQTSNTGTERIEFGNMYTDAGMYTLRMGLRLIKDGEVVDSLGNVFYLLISHRYEISELEASVTRPLDGKLPEMAIGSNEHVKILDTDWSKKAPNGEYYLMEEGETFKNGEQYECIVEFVIDDPEEEGYYFAETPKAYINDMEAKLFNHDEKKAALGVYFTCETPMAVLFTPDSKPFVGEKITVDIETMAEQSEELMEAYLDGKVTYQWYSDNSELTDFTDATINLEHRFANHEIYVTVTFGDTTIKSDKFMITYQTSDTESDSDVNTDTGSDTETDSEVTTDTDTSTESDTDTDMPSVLLGDVTGDGKIQMDDVVEIQKAIAQLTQLNDTQKIAADVNKDGKVTMDDVVTIQRYIAKLITSF